MTGSGGVASAIVTTGREAPAPREEHGEHEEREELGQHEGREKHGVCWHGRVPAGAVALGLRPSEGCDVAQTRGAITDRSADQSFGGWCRVDPLEVANLVVLVR